MPTAFLLLEYDYVTDILARRDPVRPAHLAAVESAVKAGDLLAGGAIGDPPTGALFLWRNGAEAAIDRFVAADPYRDAGLVTAHRVRPWTVVAGAPNLVAAR